ncbi:MAG: SusD/RagB family nutrient-binding outer membrane lipoprotein, partial [Bacteroidota bacterium]
MNTLSKVGLVLVTMFIVSCSDLTDLDINQNPNAPSPENAEIGFLYNQVQLAFAGTGTGVGDGFIPTTWGVTSTATRMRAMTSFFYREQYQDVNFNNMWNDAYSNMFPDVTAIENLASEGTAFLYEANTARIMKAYVMTSLVDIFGDVPFAEAGLGTDAQNPANQDGASIYAAAEELLDQAIAGLADASTSPSNDLFYGGDKSKWITLANTLKLRIYNNTRLVDQSAGSKMMAIISAGDFIDEASEDFEFQFSSSRNDPDARHPFYDTDYEQTDGGYMNNYYMWLLVGDKPMRDPRTRFYFYRQQSVFSEANININDWDCVITNNPFDQIPPGALDHVFAVDPNLPFCIAAADGYMGRDHGNGQGIPPDGPLRVEYGVYPAGGRWDNNSFANTQNSGVDGALGEGIQPIWQSSWTDFIRAEAALTAGTGEDARALLESAVRKSIAKVLSFQANVPAADL